MCLVGHRVVAEGARDQDARAKSRSRLEQSARWQIIAFTAASIGGSGTNRVRAAATIAAAISTRTNFSSVHKVAKICAAQNSSSENFFGAQQAQKYILELCEQC